MTRSYAVLRISSAAYREIRDALAAAGYGDQLQERPGGEVLVMHGLGLQERQPPLARCGDCGWGGFTADQAPASCPHCGAQPCVPLVEV